MSTMPLDFHEIDAVARQAVDLLAPEAHLTITETLRNNAYVYPQATGGDHGLWRISVTIAPGNSATVGVDPAMSPAAALGHLIIELGAACHHHFRGRPFPACPAHDHVAHVEVVGGDVVLRCPADPAATTVLVPRAPER